MTVRDIKGFETILIFNKNHPEMQYAAPEEAQVNQKEITQVARNVIHHMQTYIIPSDNFNIIKQFTWQLDNINTMFTRNGFVDPFKLEIEKIITLLKKSRIKEVSRTITNRY